MTSIPPLARTVDVPVKVALKVTVGRAVSITTEVSAVEVAEFAPPKFCTAENEYVPSGRDVNVHVCVVTVATKVHVMGAPVAGVAVMVTVAPTRRESTLISGVLSDVILSEFDVPKSELAAKVTAVGAPRTRT